MKAGLVLPDSKWHTDLAYYVLLYPSVSHLFIQKELFSIIDNIRPIKPGSFPVSVRHAAWLPRTDPVFQQAP